MLETDSQTRNADEMLHVTFYVKSVRNNFMSNKEQREIFQDENYVQIMIPGRTDTVLDVPVDESHKRRFPRQWAIFQNQNADAAQTPGTPVSEWPAISRSQAEELKGQKFYTVEQIASCSDGQIQALGMNGSLLRQKARIFLESAKGSSLAQQQADELKKKDEEIATLKARMEAFEQKMAAFDAKPARQKREMTDEQRKAVGERLKAGREAKKVAVTESPPNG